MSAGGSNKRQSCSELPDSFLGCYNEEIQKCKRESEHGCTMSKARESEHKHRDEYTTRRSARREECNDGNDEHGVGARGKTARRARDSRRHGEKLNRRDGSTSFADWSNNTSETCRGCRLTIRHQTNNCEAGEKRARQKALTRSSSPAWRGAGKALLGIEGRSGA